MSELVLDVAQLRASYGKVQALHDINLKLERGSIATVIGPNGAGKSTLLNAIMGVLPAQGTVRYQGKPVERWSLEQRVMAGIALVPERRELFSTMSVEDNLLLGGFRRLRLRQAQPLDQLATVFELFPRLKERRAQQAGTLSGGERQMLAIGRAMMAKPELLMLDEPSLGLAPRIVKEILHIVSELRTAGISVLLVEQNARAALQTADYGYVLELGKVTMQGESAKLAGDPQVIQAYLGFGKKAEAEVVAAS
ncbi:MULTISPECIES: ABC transporter ATP-binding protein [Herbaspirillum]|jgi:amino acid/amide ABC transporter ATP-binding protein 2, HAAT family (TC 3.A.1.4.-)|uniref:ABC transporter ATP-binding protein n=4 Tax=Pseudomonadota TaxID=1224 RepID=A0AAJ2H4H7_9BURK|nr:MULTISPECIES: ABC transporter ATP-binding protein [Herbaspirillum]MAF04250.1 ABC transporter ATP-binding protein [Herbaspirillum sp.]MBN9355751.1 ABC transporter ATP-binding protein [Herbaspirillum huttiense]MBO14094.1 ABC transporter ATP-binding protein [Herbaspirillum sp.]MBP1317859.1 branched-chain amino acid transport system ATP-binding protein [Herbaspirillum sp. 1130]MCO4857203.1 ABC transporter ATP-binding protein [Herbaspirillum sp. WGmk3]